MDSPAGAGVHTRIRVLPEGPELPSILTLGDRCQFRTLFPSAPRVCLPNGHLGTCPTDPSFQKCSRFLHPWLSRTFWGSQTQQVHCSRNLLWSDSWPHAQHQRAQLPRGAGSLKEAAFQPGGLDKLEPASHCSLPKAQRTPRGVSSAERHLTDARPKGEPGWGPRLLTLAWEGGQDLSVRRALIHQLARGTEVNKLPLNHPAPPQGLRPTRSGQENLGFLTQHQALGGKPRPPEACLR